MTADKVEDSTVYSLVEGFIGGQKFEIDASQYTTLNEALTTLVSAMEIEELFQVFALSYLGFEKDLLEIAFEYTYAKTESLGDLEFFSSIRQRLNVSIITILTAFQSYDDQCNRILMTSINPPEASEFNRKTRSIVFDGCFSYRICANLRNYAQHRSLPLGGFSIGINNNFENDGSGREVKIDAAINISPWLNISKFKDSSQCKANLRSELENLKQHRVDIKWLMRSFAGAMYERHSALRDFLKPKIETASEKITWGYGIASASKSDQAHLLELHGGGEERHMRADLGAKVMRSFETYKSLKSAERSYITLQIKPATDTYSGRANR